MVPTVKDNSKKTLKALILGSPDPVSMGLLRGWMMAGHGVAEVWFPQRDVGSSTFKRDQSLATTAPGVSMHALSARAGFVKRPVQPLSQWAQMAAKEAKALAPDIVLSLMFMDRIPLEMIAAFPGRIFNLHPSLLPHYRGAAAVLNMLVDQSINDYGGVTLHLVDGAFDSGAIIGQMRVPFSEEKSVAMYFMELVRAGTPLLVQSIERYLAGEIVPQVQDQIHLKKQCCLKPNEIELTSRLNIDKALWICRHVTQIADVRIKGLASNMAVSRMIEVSRGSHFPKMPLEDNQVVLQVSDGQIMLELKPLKN
jgi:methionyl-tRNA formyltransferase